ncbi:interferon-induced, double-stranded RNA-activated protein kinase isoform X2 [Cephus cinctus]|uniref:non-specific serine/threonine protein kinase n=1 Tax=Cephus cinctus TaxID=211228 RepID=A0AAJ7FPJ6_CEPCN|nr:interferon-induced, double-stranded RNA-activated protein kinase isoform X2 [Cephus cinctus]
MDNSAQQQNGPLPNLWSSLSTVTTFDTGNDTWTTRRIDDNAEAKSATGQIVGRASPSTSILIESLIQQLCTMFEGDAVRRNKLYYAICDRLHEMKLIDGSYNMRELEIIRGQYQRALYHLVTVARASTGSESALQVPSCLMAEWSRYRREFKEIGFIAAGGFGHVFKALHRLDEIEYAVKKIIVRSDRLKTIMQHLAEVKMIAKLNHANIVSYKGAWIEPTLPPPFVTTLLSTTQDKMSHRNSKNISNSISSYSRSHSSNRNHSRNRGRKKNGTVRVLEESSYQSVKKSECLDDNIAKSKNITKSYSTNERTYYTGERIIETNNSTISRESYSDVVSFRNDTEGNETQNAGDWSIMNNADKMNTYENSSESESFEESVSDRRICQYNSSKNWEYTTLYIQMTLCEKTLQQWLHERNEPTPESVVTAIVTQILYGLNYIHSLGIVHHDIKPSNIFILTSGHLQIQLGDFGLACPLQRERHSVCGTKMYAAPEQLRGKCDPKSDIYSLGIVLLELLVFTKTFMELDHIIQALKAGQIPTSLTTNYPKWARLVQQLVQKDPNKRPNTKQLLQELTEDKEVTIVRLRDENEKKDNLIEQLQNEVAILKAEIVKLKISKEDT